MDDKGMYGSRAELYDPIYHWKDYAAEAERLAAILGELGVADGARVLEAACGTGSHMARLAGRYRLTGFDRSAAMLEQARAKLPQAELFRADMADFRVAEPFDALLCLFSAIGYVYPEERLGRAAQAFAAAVRPGGGLVIEPWLTPETATQGKAALHSYDSEELKLARMVVTEIEGRLVRLDFHWLVARPGRPVTRFLDRHELWLYTHEEMLAAFEAAGFELRFEPDGLMPGRGLWLGTRR